MSPLPARLVTLAAASALAALTLAACSDGGESCQVTTDCSHGVCVEGSCRAVRCSAPTDCPADSRCDPAAHQCLPAECRSNADCTADRTRPFCASGQCRAEAPAECTDRTFCELGEACLEATCTAVDAGAACTGDEDCGNPEICDQDRGQGRHCTPACTSDDDCADLAGLNACNQATGLCEAVECMESTDCDPEQVCDAHACEVARFPCADLVCNDPDRPFQTEPIGDLCRCVQCLGNNHCDEAAGEVCTSGFHCLVCDATATDASDCPETLPLLRDGCCVACLTDADCVSQGVGAACHGGRCAACDCNHGCDCPDGTSCVTQGDGSGRCQAPAGLVGDPCLSQDQCADSLACSYAVGKCVPQGTGDFCTAGGCPAPSRCAATAAGSLCYGCIDDGDCPDGFACQHPAEWDGIFVGGQCLPSG